MGVCAKIEQSAPNHPPTMGEGDIDTALLWDWFIKSENFLRHKNTMAQDMVKTVAYGMTSVYAICWLAANGPLLLEMDWDTNKEQMHVLFLPTDWEYTARMAVLRLKQGSRPFMDFALDTMARNNLLASTVSFMNNDFLRDAIEAGMDPELAQECHRENTNRLTKFRAWLDEVKRLDERRRQRFNKIAKEFARLSIRTTVPGRVPPKMAAFAKLTASSSSSSSSTTQSMFVPIPKLTDAERCLLQENGGCYKCRRFFAGHIGPRCPNPPIDGASYKTLTTADVPAHPASYLARGNTARVATIVEGGSATVEELINFESSVETVAAVLPNIASAVVETGSPDYSDDDTSYDLLHASASVASRPVPLWKTGHTRASEVCAAQRRAHPAIRDVLLGEEMTACLRPRLNAHPSRGQRGSRSSNIIAALKECIEDLNTIETFEAQLKGYSSGPPTP
ncbi:hypothetical protein BDN71DRAFT_1513801 [Pleurotus eryngii]|uniref:Uncharacterized protein n=1 Tax=Pleurotus eryngii TaxID=5323 RepID=A0A9P5ZG37_PLEER|nr:hypothetical protein BDN71DRAFT_1513801 [Pleurotus eryngii]